MYTDPKLDYASQHPTSTYGHSVEAEIKPEHRRAASGGHSRPGRTVLLLHLDLPVLSRTVQGIEGLCRYLRTDGETCVALDGVGLPEYPQPATNNGMAENVGVHMVPMIYLAIPEENFLKPLGAGLMTNADLRERLLVLLLVTEDCWASDGLRIKDTRCEAN